MGKFGLVATKTSGGDSWNCSIIGNTKIPEYEISKWKIKLNNFNIKNNTWNILIGVGPKNLNNQPNYYFQCWSFICGNSLLALKSSTENKYYKFNA